MSKIDETLGPEAKRFIKVWGKVRTIEAVTAKMGWSRHKVNAFARWLQEAGYIHTVPGKRRVEHTPKPRRLLLKEVGGPEQFVRLWELHGAEVGPMYGFKKSSAYSAADDLRKRGYVLTYNGPADPRTQRLLNRVSVWQSCATIEEFAAYYEITPRAAYNWYSHVRNRFPFLQRLPSKNEF